MHERLFYIKKSFICDFSANGFNGKDDEDGISFAKLYISGFNLDVVIRNYFSVSLRNLVRNRIYTILTILGLSVGLTAFFLIHLYVTYEKSYDTFFDKRDRIFRLQQDRYNQGELTNSTVAVCAGAGPAIAANFPAVESYVKVLHSPAVMTYETKVFEESNFYFVSEDFFHVFSVPLLQGVDSQVLHRPSTVVLSRSAARRYFGDENPMGKVLDFRGIFRFEVTGVFEDLPANSHMEIDFMASFETYAGYAGERATTSWKWDAYYTYLLVRTKEDALTVEKALPELVQRETGEWLKASNQDLKLHLQPLTSIHLFSHFKKEMQVNGNHKMVYYLSLIAYFIIAIAYINYVNVATAKSLERAKEVGVRKVLGGYRLQLMVQFLAESFIMNTVALFISLISVYVTIPFFAELCGREINAEMMRSGQFVLLAGCVLIGGALLAGLYPALVLSGFKPTEVLKGKLTGSRHGGLLRKGLVTLQFITSIILIICTHVVFRQIQFLRTQSLGFTIDEVLIVNAPLKKDSLYADQMKAFKTAVLRLPEVGDMTSLRERPGAPIVEYVNGIKRLGAGDDEMNQYQMITVDEDFTNVFDLTMVAGRSYNASDPDDNTVIVVNERACELLGYRNPEEALSQRIVAGEDTLEIIGVIQNYHHETLKFSVSPILFPLDPSYGSFLPIRLAGGKPSEVIQTLSVLYSQYFPGNPFNAYFLNDHFEQQYRSDVQFGKVVGIFSTVAIIITCLGLFGLSSYTVLLRMKEIGVRKVLGATDASIVGLLARDYSVLIALAMIIAIPSAWYIMNGWLQNFANKINLTAWYFVLPCFLVALIAALTISTHVLRAMRSNPIDTIRHE